MNFLKFFFLIIITFLTFSISFAQDVNYQGFLQKLKLIDFPLDNIQDQDAVSRYNVAKALGIVDCFNCNLPSKEWKNELNQNWFSGFVSQSDNHFNDISYGSTSYNGENYYYCVAYVGYKDYMNGYPNKGEFVGTNNLTFREFVRISFNITSRYIYDSYLANWDNIKYWIENNSKKYLMKKGINQQDKNIIINASQSCDGDCEIKNANEFQAYIKYCSLNIDSCDFQNIGGLQEGSPILGPLNILYEENILDLNTIDGFNSFNDPISGSFLLENVYDMYMKTDCTIDLDYDNDGVKNSQDNCLYTYDPDQSDIDNDGIGDVCDTDIDGDGLNNTKGLVDDDGNILYDKFNTSNDKNPLKKNNNGINGEQGEGESKGEGGVGLYINGSPKSGKAPLQVDFSSEVSGGDCDSMDWNFGDGNFGEGINPSHTYRNPGKYNVVAKCNSSTGNEVVAKMNIKVSMDLDSKFSFQAKGYPLKGEAPQDIKLWPEYKGDVDKVKWIIGDFTKTVSANSEYTHNFEYNGDYEIKAQAINEKGEKIGFSKLNVNLSSENSLGSNLRASNIKPKIGESVQFATENIGFKESKVDYIKWDFGDGVVQENNSLNLRKSYNKEGLKIITQTIYLDSGETMENTLSIYVYNQEDVSGRGTELSSNPLVQNVGENFIFQLDKKGISNNDISSIFWSYGNGTTSFHQNNIGQNLTKDYSYFSPGSYRVRAEINLKNGQFFVNEATVIASGEDICKNPESLSCDMDNDGVPDMCDTDIDGDGTENMLGLIKYEKESCKIKPENINQNRLSEEEKLSLDENVDNCPFIGNSDQIDTNANGKGDACDDGENYLDTDGDGLLDNEDSCPNTPENFNGYEDNDGCPELNFEKNGSYVEVGNCNSCPCQYADFDSQLWKGDKIRALLFGNDGKTILRKSPIKKVEEGVNP